MAGVSHLLVHCGNPPNRGFREDWISRYTFWPLMIIGAKIICCSKYVCSQYQSIPLVSKSLFFTVYNCAKIDEFKERSIKARNMRSDHSFFKAIMVATLENHKDHLTLLKSVSTIKNQISNFKLFIVGDGSMREVLIKACQALGIADVVVFMGSRNDVPELLGSSDLFLFSTTSREGLGTVLIEALAAGIPIISSDVPACRELLEDGKLGTLVPAGDSYILGLAISKFYRNRIAVTNNYEYNYLDRFYPHYMVSQYLKIGLASTKN
jgi:glycosyltransferase involved in cell wall biosynthesis